MAREYLNTLHPNGKKTSAQKKSYDYFDAWVDYVKVCQSCNTTILIDGWKYSELKTEISCGSCGVYYQFPTGKRNRQDKTPFTYNKKEKEMFGKNTESNTTTETTEKVKLTPEQKFKAKEDRLEASITKKDDTIAKIEKKLVDARTSADKRIVEINKDKEKVELELFRHLRSKK